MVRRDVCASDDLVERELDDADGAGFDQLGKQLADSVLADDRLDREPFLALEIWTRIKIRYGWRGDRGQQSDDRFQMFARDVHLDPDAALGVERALHQHADLTNLFALPAVLPSAAIGHQHPRRS